jgi:hypothetical protein
MFTLPIEDIRFRASLCLSSNLRLRDSPPPAPFAVTPERNALTVKLRLISAPTPAMILSS